MSISRKETAWKKSRKFGDVMGGRKFPKITDRIFNRYHSIQPPSVGDNLPIIFRDNPSRDFYFPVNQGEILDRLSQLPKKLYEGITHIWLRKIKDSIGDGKDTIQGMFICGSKVNLIVLNAFPKNLRMYFGDKKPSASRLKFYSKWTKNLAFDDRSQMWYLQWDEHNIKDYYLNHLLLHEVGHFVDSLNERFWSKTADKKKEDFADTFAVIWGSKTKEIIESNEAQFPASDNQ